MRLQSEAGDADNRRDANGDSRACEHADPRRQAEAKVQNGRRIRADSEKNAACPMDICPAYPPRIFQAEASVPQKKIMTMMSS